MKFEVDVDTELLAQQVVRYADMQLSSAIIQTVNAQLARFGCVNPFTMPQPTLSAFLGFQPSVLDYSQVQMAQFGQVQQAFTLPEVKELLDDPEIVTKIENILKKMLEEGFARKNYSGVNGMQQAAPFPGFKKPSEGF